MYLRCHTHTRASITRPSKILKYVIEWEERVINTCDDADKKTQHTMSKKKSASRMVLVWWTEKKCAHNAHSIICERWTYRECWESHLNLCTCVSSFDMYIWTKILFFLLDFFLSFFFSSWIRLQVRELVVSQKNDVSNTYKQV